MLSDNVSSKAMLVHRHTFTGMVSVTSHDVIALDGGTGFTLGAGRAFSPDDKAELASILLNEDSQVDFLQETQLVRSKTVLVWYRKPGLHSIPFPQGQIEAPLPGLVFIADSRGLRCFAYKGAKRPTAETPLFYPPLGNVFTGGTFCSGNVNLPREIRVQNIPAWESFVLDSKNTHAGSVQPVLSCKGLDELVTFYRELSKAKAKRFPSSQLVKVTGKEGQQTLGQAIVRGEA